MPSKSYYVSATAAVAGAIGVSLCCLGPFLLLALGISGVHLIDAIEPYRPFIIAGELGAYLAYRHFRPAPSCDANSPSSGFKQLVFWIALTAIVGGIVVVAT